MHVLSSTKAVSTIITILLIILSAIAGGIISYMFTIPQFIEVPEKTTVVITGVYFNRDNARSFKIGVLNPSYSPANATITRVALSFKGDSQLYDIVETSPSIEGEIVIQKGEALNITCIKIRKEGFSIGWGDFVAEFPGRTVILHVFSSDSPAANIEAILPFVKLDITEVRFDPNVSFGNFTVTIMNDNMSEIYLIINEILAISIEVKAVSPGLPYTLLNGENATFACTGNWSELAKSRTILTISVSTEEGYLFSEKFNLPVAEFAVQNVTFNEDYTDHFNVTIKSSATQSVYGNITRISCILDNGTVVERYPLAGIGTNSTLTFTIDWDWREYRGRIINVIAYLLQDYQTATFTAITPSPFIIRVLNEDETFNLQDRTHFNITLLSHQSSVDAVNITKIVVKETGELINGTRTDPQLPYGLFYPSQTQAFYCNITDWTERAGGNLTLTIYVVANKTSQEHLFEFKFTLPKAELNITNIETVSDAKYLNVTVENLDYSAWNLTISKVRITLQGQTEPLEQIFPENQTVIRPSETAFLLCLFDWEKYHGENITVTVITKEGVEASQTFQIP